MGRPFRAAPERQRGFQEETEQWRCRRSEAEPHAPTGLSPSGDWGWTDRISERALQGRTGASARFPHRNRSSAGAGAAKRSRMPRRGCHRQVTGGGQTGFLKGPFRAAPERQRGFRKETEQRRCRRSEAEPHAPTGLSPSGDWGWTDRISVRNPVKNDKILIFRIILLNINSSN